MLLGSAVTAVYARSRDWTIAVPVSALAGGIGVALAVGALAGLYPRPAPPGSPRRRRSAA